MGYYGNNWNNFVFEGSKTLRKFSKIGKKSQGTAGALGKFFKKQKTLRKIRQFMYIVFRKYK